MAIKDFTAVDSIKKALLNYELLITAVHAELTSVQASIGRYKGYHSKKYQRLYEMYYWEEKRLLKYLDALREGQQKCKSRITELLEMFYSNEAYRQIWYSHFIEGKTSDEIAELTSYDPRTIRNIIASFRKDLINLGFKTYGNDK